MAAGEGLESILQADVGAGAGLKAVPAGEFVGIEQVGIVEDQALGVFDRERALIDVGCACDDLADGFDDVRSVRGTCDPRIGDGYATGCKAAR